MLASHEDEKAVRANLVASATPPNQEVVRLNVKFEVWVELHLRDSSSEAITARIYRVSAGLVELSSPVYLQPNEELEIACEGRWIQSRVVYCRRQADGSYDMALRIAEDAYIRAETRIPLDLATTLHVLGSLGSIPIRVVDVSPSGVGMELPVPLPVGTRVSVTLGYSTALGEIRHCAANGPTHRAGIRLDKLIRCKDASARTWTDLSGNSVNMEALAAFEHSVEERQVRAEAFLLSFVHPLSKGDSSL